MFLFLFLYSFDDFDDNYDYEYNPEYPLIYNGIGKGYNPILLHNSTEFPFFSKNSQNPKSLNSIENVFQPTENTQLDIKFTLNQIQNRQDLLQLPNDTKNFNLISKAIQNNIFIQFSIKEIPFWIRIGEYANNEDIFIYLNHNFIIETNKKHILTIIDHPFNKTLYQQKEYEIQVGIEWIDNPSISPVRRYNIFWRKSFFPSHKIFFLIVFISFLIIIFLLKSIYSLHKKYSSIKPTTFSIAKYTNALSSISGIGASYALQSFIFPILAMILGTYFNFKRMIYIFSFSMTAMMFVSGYIGTTIGIYLKKKYWIKICLFNIIGCLYLIFLVPLNYFFILLIISFILSFSGGKIAIDDPLIEVWEDNVIMMMQKSKSKPITLFDLLYALIITIPIGIIFPIVIYFITYFLLMYNFVYAILILILSLIIIYLFSANVSIRIAIKKNNSGDSSWQWLTFITPLFAGLYFFISLLYAFNYFIQDLNSGAMKDSIFYSFILSLFLSFAIGSIGLISASSYMYIHAFE